MTLHMMKSGLVILLALVVGASQLCACMASMNASPMMAAPFEHQSTVMEMGDHGAYHDEDSDHDMHGDETGCAHCSAPSLLETTLVAEFSALLSQPEIEKNVPSLLATASDGIAQTLSPIARGHAWLDPPPTTPITLKIRLLN